MYCNDFKNLFKLSSLLQTVQRGDVLYVRVASHVHDLLCVVKVQAAVRTTVRDLFDADIKVSFLLIYQTEKQISQANSTSLFYLSHFL